MKRLLILLPLLVLAGCATHSSRREMSGFNDYDERRQDHDFFYGNIWKPAPSPYDAEDRAFFYRSHD